MVRIDSESLWTFRLDLTDHLEGSAPSQGIKKVSVGVVGHYEDQRMRFQRSEVGIVQGTNRGVFDRPVHTLDLAIAPRVAGFGQSMFDAILVADAIKNVSTEPISRTSAILELLSERHTVISQDGLDLVWKRLRISSRLLTPHVINT